MKRQMTLAQYRSVDITLFALLLAVFESIITLAATGWFPGQLYTVSLTPALCAIVLMRWGGWAGLHALLGGGVFALVSGGTLRQLAIYALGNLACLLTLPVLRGTGKERIRSDKLLTLLFALGVCLLMQLGRAAAALAMGTEPGLCTGFFTTDALSALFAMVIVSLARRLDGLFEDQKCYLLRCQRQRDKEKGGF